MWCLFALTQAPEVQRKLREELLSVDTDKPDMDQLNALPYLDAVVRETLRVHAPVPIITRVAMKDDVIPVAEPFVDRYGKLQNHIEYVLALYQNDFNGEVYCCRTGYPKAAWSSSQS